MPGPTTLRTPSLLAGDVASKREEILAYFLATFSRYEQLFELLADDRGFLQKSINLRHPLIFYLGHTATFFINKLLLARLIDERINPRFESIFAVGVDEMSWDDLNEDNYDWPSVAAVRDYRRQVRELVSEVIRTAPLSLPIDAQNPWWAILMGIEHELIHLETSSVLIRQHPLELVRAHPQWRPWPSNPARQAPLNRLLPVPAGVVQLGKAASDDLYGWDNEYGRHRAEVAAFAASQLLVSNQEFLQFVADNGYSEPRWWDAEGLAWREFAKAHWPTFWRHGDSGWCLRLLTEEIAMPWDWPVEVNYLEAKAFCNWKAAQLNQPARLPSEDQWQRLYQHSGMSDERTPERATANIQLDHHASPCPVDQFKHGEFYDVRGNVWQWSETPTYPFDGFAVLPIYDDFSTPTFDQRHNLFQGGSWISCGNQSLRSARYAFRRHFFQHAGFRYIVAESPAMIPASNYEHDKLLSEYAEFHYGDCYFGVPNFSRALAELAIQTMGDQPALKALDLGCASGRASFELAKHFAQVTGIDFSARFIGQGVQLAETGQLRYTRCEEGELVSYQTRRLDELGLDGVRNKVEFFQGDACNLKPQFSGYDLILAANLIDRLYDPAQFLAAVHERLNLGGILLLASPYTWLTEHTPREAWLGGFKKDGENFTTLDGLKAILNQHFQLLAPPQEIPFVIRETRHKFQHSLSEVSLWRRVS
ncbi:MAG: SAM-dependent methyltransferase [Pseudomonadales bacterium RIFCSPLOWO2_12_59_9]|nr:MAG: SAM-dependent methyltransferase [Pseudomonadales bacterium RIFCSPLOWO2_12_59_9]